MNEAFPRVLCLLRKEKGVSQKNAAEALGISQALLSHYERGIREPGFSFLCACADFYGVSCDYLLGRSPDKTGSRITVEELPEDDPRSRERGQGGILPILNKKLIVNSLQILYDLMGRAGCKALVTEVSSFLMLSVYRAFRVLYAANPHNQSTLFSVSPHLYDAYADAASRSALARASALASGQPVPEELPLEDPSKLTITNDSLTSEYPLYASSLLNLVINAEAKIHI